MRWLVTVERWEPRSDVEQRLTLTASCAPDKVVFDKLAAGRLNAVAAVLRGDLEVEGDWRLLVRIQRLFPGPPALTPTEGDVMSDGLVQILDGNTFVVSNSNGDIEASLTDPTGSLLLRHALPVALGADAER